MLSAICTFAVSSVQCISIHTSFLPVSVQQTPVPVTIHFLQTANRYWCCTNASDVAILDHVMWCCRPAMPVQPASRL